MWIGLAASLAVLCGAGGEALAQSGDFEVGPWLGWAAGIKSRGASETDYGFLSAGFDVTVPVETFGSVYGGAFEWRMGPWVGATLAPDRPGTGEGGLTMILTQTEHASWGTYGVRFGAGTGETRFRIS
ncbi:MAG: hypothetical protein R3F14_05370 [Polyangiaceae bacterium]